MQVVSDELSKRFDLINTVAGHGDTAKIYLGQRGTCRFCGSTDPTKFRQLAHAFPEALGNKWVFSLDECDDCNQLFSVYETALATSVGAILTLGGTKGKGNKVRQTGRTDSSNRFQHTKSERRRIHLSGSLNDAQNSIRFDSARRKMAIEIAVPRESYIPRHAYKALAKMGLALLPLEDLIHYRRLISWLQNRDDVEPFHLLPVGISFGSVGNAPPNVFATLLRRKDPSDVVPFTVLMFCAGSVCLQVDLMSDSMEDHLPPTPINAVNITWKTIISDGMGDSEEIHYGAPIHMNWASAERTLQPIEAIGFEFCLTTHQGHFSPIFRQN